MPSDSSPELHPTPRELQLEQVRIGTMTLRVARWPGSAKPVPILLFNGIGGNFELLNPFVAALGDDEADDRTVAR